MVPLYPKIRLSAHDLIGFAGWLLPKFRDVVCQDARDNLMIDLRFCQAGDCLATLFHSKIPPERTSLIAKGLILSRYVGMIKFSVGNELVAYVVCDSTDIRRDIISEAPLLAIIPFFKEHIEAFKDYSKKFNTGALVA